MEGWVCELFQKSLLISGDISTRWLGGSAVQAGLIFSFFAWAGRCVAARWRPRAASTSHFGCFARLPAPLRWLSALARLGEAGPAPRAPRVVLAGALRPAARFACAPGLASCERWPGGVRWPLGGPARPLELPQPRLAFWAASRSRCVRSGAGSAARRASGWRRRAPVGAFLRLRVRTVQPTSYAGTRLFGRAA